MSDLILVLGPMKSGKSYELISYFAPLRYSKVRFGLYQPLKNVRDSAIKSRNGVFLKAKKVKSLFDILRDAQKQRLKVVGIDEIHMFSPKGIVAVKEMLFLGVKVWASGLDKDYRGKLFPIIQRLMELGPSEIQLKKSVCEICKEPQAVFTQILKNQKPIFDGLPSVVPEDGTYEYRPVCRECFQKTKDEFSA